MRGSGWWLDALRIPTDIGDMVALSGLCYDVAAQYITGACAKEE
jgi:hypothetical protein